MADSFGVESGQKSLISVYFSVFGVSKGSEGPVLGAGFWPKVLIHRNTPKYTEISMFTAS